MLYGACPGRRALTLATRLRFAAPHHPTSAPGSTAPRLGHHSGGCPKTASRGWRARARSWARGALEHRWKARRL